MAKPKTLSASKLLVLLGNGATPTEVFTAPCGITTRGIAFGKDTTDVTVPDCDDPDAPSWVERDVRSLSGTITGSGILALEALPTWWEFYNSTTPTNARVKLDAPALDNGGHWAGAFICTEFSVTGDLGDKVAVAVTLISSGEIVWVDAA
jgi:predicted secreted protein